VGRQPNRSDQQLFLSLEIHTKRSTMLPPAAPVQGVRVGTKPKISGTRIVGYHFDNPNYQKSEKPDPKFSGNPNAHPTREKESPAAVPARRTSSSS
jgi:hypothetical protein